MHVQALDPPEGRVPPVTPFVGDQKLADHPRRGLLREFGDDVEASRRGVEHPLRSTAQPIHVHLSALRLQSHRRCFQIVRLDRLHQPAIKHLYRGMHFSSGRIMPGFEVGADAPLHGDREVRVHVSCSARENSGPDRTTGFGAEHLGGLVQGYQALALQACGHATPLSSAASAAISSKLRPLSACRASSPVWACQRRIAVSA